MWKLLVYMSSYTKGLTSLLNTEQATKKKIGQC